MRTVSHAENLKVEFSARVKSSMLQRASRMGHMISIQSTARSMPRATRWLDFFQGADPGHTGWGKPTTNLLGRQRRIQWASLYLSLLLLWEYALQSMLTCDPGIYIQSWNGSESSFVLPGFKRFRKLPLFNHFLQWNFLAKLSLRQCNDNAVCIICNSVTVI